MARDRRVFGEGSGTSSVPCTPAGITNYDEYSLVREIMEEKKEEVTGTLKKDKTLLRDEKKMEKLKQKLHTDDERMCWRVLGMESARVGGGGDGSRASCLGVCPSLLMLCHCLQ